MKEQYLSPELQSVLFAPVQTVASNIFDFDDLEDLAGGTGSNGGTGVDGSPGDINHPFHA